MDARRIPKLVQHSRKTSQSELVKKKKSPILTPPQVFHRAAMQGDLETVEAMAPQWKASKGALGNTALHWASAAGHTDVVRSLLKLGVDIDMTNDMLDTALHSAAWRGFGETAQVLLEAGCSRDSVNKDGKTPPQLAAQRFSDDHPIVQVLPKFTAEELADVGGGDVDGAQLSESSSDSECEDKLTF